MTNGQVNWMADQQQLTGPAHPLDLSHLACIPYPIFWLTVVVHRTTVHVANYMTSCYAKGLHPAC